MSPARASSGVSMSGARMYQRYGTGTVEFSQFGQFQYGTVSTGSGAQYSNTIQYNLQYNAWASSLRQVMHSVSELLDVSYKFQFSRSVGYVRYGYGSVRLYGDVQTVVVRLYVVLFVPGMLYGRLRLYVGSGKVTGR